VSKIEVKADEFGFKVASIPEQTKTIELYNASRNNEAERIYTDCYLISDFIYQGVEIGSNAYLAGTYYYKDNKVAEYLALKSDDFSGLFIKSRTPDGRDIKSVLYSIKEGWIRLQTHTDDKEGSSHNFHNFKSDGENKFLPFSKEDMEIFKDDFIRLCGECENLDKVIDISSLIAVMMEKGIVNKR